jgi:hypothetical protein
MTEHNSKAPSYLHSLLFNKCPRCRKGDLFVGNEPYNLKNGNNVKMHSKCPVCTQPTELEVGFYYGTSYVSYGLTVAFSGLSFVIWFFTIGFNLEDNRIFWWLGLNALVLLLLQPLFMRISRSMWISWFVDYDSQWQENNPKEVERQVPEHQNNW